MGKKKVANINKHLDLNWEGLLGLFLVYNCISIAVSYTDYGDSHYVRRRAKAKKSYTKQ